MIAWAGCERLALGLTDTLDVAPRARWPLDGDEWPRRRGKLVSFQRIAVDRRGRMGHGARQLRGARRPRRDAVGARSRRRSPTWRRRAMSPRPARRPARRARRRDRRHRGRRACATPCCSRCRRRTCAPPRPGSRRMIAHGMPVVACAKGIERGTHKFMTEVIAETLPDATPAILSGPSFAADVARGLPTAVTLACADEATAAALARALGSPTFRPYHTTDVRGVEIGGAAKNVLAIAAGIVQGRKLGASATAALVTRGFAELARFGRALGARSRDAHRPVRASAISSSPARRRSRAISRSASRSAKAARARRQARRRRVHGARAGRACEREERRDADRDRGRGGARRHAQRRSGDRVAADAAVPGGVRLSFRVAEGAKRAVAAKRRAVASRSTAAIASGTPLRARLGMTRVDLLLPQPQLLHELLLLGDLLHRVGLIVGRARGSKSSWSSFAIASL